MLNTININLKTDIKTDKPTTLPIKLMSQDKNNNQFILRFTNGGKSVTLDDTYTIEILTKFTKSGTSRLTTAKVRQDYATWVFDTAYITQDEKVYNYVYVRKSGILVVSADANCFEFNVGLSEVDKTAGRVAEVYDENYQKYLDEFKEMMTGEGGGSYDDTDVKAHMGSTNNPHNVTKGQVGLDNVDNTSDVDKPVSTAMQSALNNKADKSQVLTDVPANAKFTDTTYTAGTGINITGDVISATGGGGGGYDDTSVVNHMNDLNNPHDVTKSQVGLGNVDDIKQASKVEFDNHSQDNTKHITASERNSWNSKQDALGFTAENISNKGQAGGYAGLDATGRVPVSQLPDFEEGLLNEATGTRLKYWFGSQVSYDALVTKDPDTIYDVWEV